MFKGERLMKRIPRFAIMKQRLTILLVLCALLSLALAASPPSFCKCTCNKNSTIIQLSPRHETESRKFSLLERNIAGSSACSQCNRALCLSYHLPICEGVDEQDVFTSCFQRDSSKDEIIVLMFITATGGLLIWAAARSLIEKRKAKQGHAEGQYLPVPGR